MAHGCAALGEEKAVALENSNKVLFLKSKIRNKQAEEADLKRALSTAMPSIDRLVTKMQHKLSHCR